MNLAFSAGFVQKQWEQLVREPDVTFWKIKHARILSHVRYELNWNNETIRDQSSNFNLLNFPFEIFFLSTDNFFLFVFETH